MFYQLDRSSSVMPTATAGLKAPPEIAPTEQAPARTDPTPAPGRHRIAGLAEKFMRANLNRPLLTTAVCAEFDVSERTLRYAFRDRFGTSPQAHFRALRLNAIRREIVAADGAIRVQHLARRWGFVHLGKFAADYRNLFGELPSATARRA